MRTTRRPILEPDPELNLKLVFVADILGFTETVRRARTLSRGRIALNQFKLMMTDALEALNKHRPAGKTKPRTWNVRTYTDNFMLETRLQRGGGNDINNVLQAVAAFQHAVLQHGFLTRGALTIGYNYTDHNVIFGQGLVEAHDLESTTAVMPRIILANSVRRLISFHQRESATRLDDRGVIPPLLEDHDGQWFVSYLSEALARTSNQKPRIDLTILTSHERVLNKNLQDKNLEPRVRNKYVWAAVYHNWFIERFAGPRRRPSRIEIPDIVRPTEPRFLGRKSLSRLHQSFIRRVDAKDELPKDAVRVAARPTPRGGHES